MGSLKQQGWEIALSEAVEEALQRPFEWSRHDCATWAFSVRARLTGIDATPAWAGKYQTLAGGLRLMRTLGWPTYAAMGNALLGAPLPSVLLGQRGDIAIGPKARGFAIVLGSEVLGLSPRGPVRLALHLCHTVWRV